VFADNGVGLYFDIVSQLGFWMYDSRRMDTHCASVHSFIRGCTTE
jgi:hypothetical protein